MSGEPSYVELGVPDVEVAKRFYADVLGWAVSDLPGGGSVETPTLGIGMHGGDAETHFEVFFAVDDLDAAIDRLERSGGRRVSGVTESAGFGRWAECRDDQGVRFGLREPERPDQAAR